MIKNNKFVENFFSLALLKGLTLIMPLITYPYLIRTLGDDRYGLVMWAWAIIDIFIIFVNFGFDLSITKHISIHRDNKTKISKIISSTIQIKMIFIFLSFILLNLLIAINERIATNSLLLYLTFFLLISESMFPIWYFQGIEKMKYTAVLTSFVKIFFTIIVFIVITDTSDYILVPIIYAFGGMLSSAFSYYIIFKRDGIYFKIFKLKTLLFYIKDSYSLFITNAATSVRDKANIIFIEFFLGLEFVAYFDIAQKFVNILITPFHILASTIYPYLAKHQNNNIIRNVLLYSVVSTITIYLLQFVFSQEIVYYLYGKTNLIIENVLNTLSLNIIFGSLSALIGINILVVNNIFKGILYSSLLSLISYIVFLSFWYLTGSHFDIHFFTILIVISFFIELIVRVYYVKKNLNKISDSNRSAV